MKILLASSEVHPYSKTGGLADMVGALALALAEDGHQVGVVTPLYRGIRERFPRIRKMDWHMDLPLGTAHWCRRKFGRPSREPGITIYFINQPHFYRRGGLYQDSSGDYADNAERFVFFSKAVAAPGRVFCLGSPKLSTRTIGKRVWCLC